MRQLLKMEWKRAWHNRYCSCMLIAGIVFAVASALMSFHSHIIYQWKNGYLGMDGIYPSTITEVWMGMDISTMCNELYMMLFPIFAVIPYASLIYEDYSSGYLNQMLIRTDRIHYFSVRYIVNFLMGGISVVLPAAINLLIAGLYAPCIPQQGALGQSAVQDDSFAADLFFHHIGIYILLYIVIWYIWGGLLANFAVVFSDMVKNKYVMLAIPFLINIICRYLISNSETMWKMQLYAYVPHWFLNPIQWVTVRGQTIVMMTAVMLMVTLYGVLGRNLDRDVL